MVGVLEVAAFHVCSDPVADQPALKENIYFVIDGLDEKKVFPEVEHKVLGDEIFDASFVHKLIGE